MDFLERAIHLAPEMVTRSIPPRLDINGPNHAAGPGRRPRTALLHWAIRWVQFILQRCHETRREEAARLIAAAALASAEESDMDDQMDRSQAWYPSLVGGHIADLRGILTGRWWGGGGVVTTHTHPL